MTILFNRIPHIIKKRSTTQILSNLMFFDTETRDIYKGSNPFLQRHSLWFGYCHMFRLHELKVTHEKIVRFTKIEHFYHLLDSRMQLKKPLYVFAHNLGFDLTIVDFWKQCKELGIRIEFAVLEDPPTIIKASWKDRRVIFIDTLNFWRTSLAKLGASIGIEKKDFPSPNDSLKIWQEYCLNDVLITSKSVYNLLTFINKHNLGSLGFTAPSLSMNSYRRRFMKNEIYIHDNVKAMQLERESYYGGRVQCFYIGKLKTKKYYYLDVNSLYPSVMRLSFPCKLLGFVNANCNKLINSIYRRCGVAAYVYINNRSHTFPKRLHDRLCYVCGKYNTFLCGAEFDRAMETNSIQHIYRFAYYQRKPLFTEFVRFFWNLRAKYKRENNVVYDNFCKLLMNSLYGKFGQNGASWREFTWESFKEYMELMGASENISKYDQDSIIHEVTTFINWFIYGIDKPARLRRLANQIQIKFPLNEHWESFPAIAGFVTAYAREQLLKYIEIAGDKHTFYCDTDSLFVDDIGFKRLRKAGAIEDSTLGKLKVVDTSNNVIIHGPKDYIFGDKKVMKGIRHDALQLNENTFQQIQFEGLKTVIKRDGGAFIDIKTINKTNKREFTKGVTNPDGFVTPFVLNEPMDVKAMTRK